MNLAQQDKPTEIQESKLCQAVPIRLDHVVIVPKLTKLEYLMRTQSLSESEVLEKYDSTGPSRGAIAEGHQAHHRALDILKKIFDAEQFIDRDKFNSAHLKDADLVIAFGGDNHFQYVSHQVEDGLVLAVNSDPRRSVGALVQLSSEDLVQLLPDLAKGDYRIEEWTRLEGSVNARPLPRVISELFIGELESVTGLADR